LLACSSEINDSVVKTCFHFDYWGYFGLVYDFLHFLNFLFFFLFFFLGLLTFNCSFSRDFSDSFCLNFSYFFFYFRLSRRLNNLLFDIGLYDNFFLLLRLIFLKKIELVVLDFSAGISDL
jgi:hypothetical protein